MNPDGPHILVIDDDQRLRARLQKYLMAQGFLVSTASSAADAEAKLKSLVFDLMIVDVMMPVMTVEKKSTPTSTGLRPARSENMPMSGETTMDVPTISARYGATTAAMRASLGSSSTSLSSCAIRTGRKNTIARSAMPRRPGWSFWPP